MCLVKYVESNKYDIPYIGFIKMVSRAPKIAEKNGMRATKVKSRFNL
tara:strand:+ start:662 stop:802 length:141 start_codon:yes stop_codon:yes gene_type:complete